MKVYDLYELSVSKAYVSYLTELSNGLERN